MPHPARHGTPTLTSLPKDDEVSCKVRPPRSPIRSLNSLDRAQLQSSDEDCISHSSRKLVTRAKQEAVRARHAGLSRSFKQVNMAQATAGQILPYHASMFLVDVHQVPEYGSPHIMANCLCTAISFKAYLC